MTFKLEDSKYIRPNGHNLALNALGLEKRFFSVSEVLGNFPGDLEGKISQWNFKG